MTLRIGEEPIEHPDAIRVAVDPVVEADEHHSASSRAFFIELIEPVFESLFVGSALLQIAAIPARATSLSRDVLNEGVDQVFSPRSERDFRAILCEEASRAFANTTTGSCNYYDLSVIFDIPILSSSLC